MNNSLSIANMALLKRKTVEALTGYSRSAIYQKISLGEFPPPVRIGLKAVAWPRAEIEAYIAALISGKSRDEMRQFVIDLINKRQFAMESRSHEYQLSAILTN